MTHLQSGSWEVQDQNTCLVSGQGLLPGSRMAVFTSPHVTEVAGVHSGIAVASVFVAWRLSPRLCTR